MKKYSFIYIVSMICFLVIAPSCTDMDEDCLLYTSDAADE